MRNTYRPRLQLLLLLLLIAVLAAPGLRASVTVSLERVPQDTGNGAFIFNYFAALSFDQRLDPRATEGNCIDISGRIIAACSPAGTFFTIYDLFGLQSVSTSVSDWVPTISYVGITPASVSVLLTDSPTMLNVTFTYTGSVIHGAPSGIVFQGFSIVSTSGVTRLGKFSSQSTKDIGLEAGTTDQEVGVVTVPGPPAANSSSFAESETPEPTSIVLTATGLLASYVRRRWAARHEPSTDMS